MANIKSKVLNLSPKEIVEKVCEAYETDSGVFIEKTNAEDLLPATNITNQIQFLFWVIQMDYATKSSKLYENANKFYKKESKWVSTYYILSKNDKELLDIIKVNFHPRYTNEILKRFKANAQELDKTYKGKAINIVKSSKSAQDLLKRIKEFRGFGDKTANFLLRTYVDILKLDYSDIDKILQPVDIHDVRLTYEWGLVCSKEMTEKNIRAVKDIWAEACSEARRSWITFDKALWLIGSKGVRTNDHKSDFEKNVGKTQW